MLKIRREFWVGSAALGMQLLAGTAWAEDGPTSGPPSASAVPAPSAPAADAARLPDIVRLKDGSLFRGTIIEMVSNDYVVIVTLTGESKRLALSDVSYAGPATKDPLVLGAPTDAEPDEEAGQVEDAEDEEGGDDDGPRITVRLRKSRLKLESNPMGYSFLSREWQALSSLEGSVTRVETQGFVELCSTPCELRLSPGKHRFALSKPDGRPVVAPSVTIPPGASRLVGTYHDNSGARAIGIALTVLAPLAGTVMVAASGGDEHGPDEGLLYGGLVTAGVGVGLGVGLILVRDTAEIKVERSASSSHQQRDQTTKSAERAPGVTWSGVF